MGDCATRRRTLSDVPEFSQVQPSGHCLPLLPIPQNLPESKSNSPDPSSLHLWLIFPPNSCIPRIPNSR